MCKSETPVQDAVLGVNRIINWKLLLCVFLTTFVSSMFIDGFIGSTIVYTLAGFGLYVWLLIFHQLFRMMRNSKKKLKTFKDYKEIQCLKKKLLRN